MVTQFHSIYFLFILIALVGWHPSKAKVIITEVADKGTADVCQGNDWVELYNSGTSAVDITGWILHDDKGRDDEDAFVFPQLEPLNAGAYLMLCNEDDTLSLSPQFGIGSSDTLTLIDTGSSSSSSSSIAGEQSEEIVSQIQLTGNGNGFDISYARDTNGEFKYTRTPTPGRDNIMTPVLSIDLRLTAQEAEGARFFNMDGRGYPVQNGMDEVVDLHITMDEGHMQSMHDDAIDKPWKPFKSVRVVSTKKNPSSSSQEGVVQEEVLLTLSNEGRIRPKGQSSLAYALCSSRSIPYVLEFNAIATLFGVERLYLRNHVEDPSFMREWVGHRMLARFGLPHLRARTVRFFINDEKMGLYTAMEAVEQDYVFHRNFPSASFDNYGLYKFGYLSRLCQVADGQETEFVSVRRAEDSSTVTGQVAECFFNMYKIAIGNHLKGLLPAYFENGRDCTKTVLAHEAIDRDLGTKEMDPIMYEFFNQHLVNGHSNEESNLAAEVDIENFLKSFAFYAVTLTQDSPLHNGNNLYLANAGDGTGWKIVPYDFNTPVDAFCNPDVCNARLIHWSIIRPTCQSLESQPLAGPLLTNATLHAKYIEHVRSFTTNVLGNVSFIQQIQQHGQAIQNDVALDDWSNGGLHFEDNLSLDPALWDTGYRFPLLPFYAARTASVLEQLEALDEGTFPRGPHLETPVGQDEICTDWRATRPDALERKTIRISPLKAWGLSYFLFVMAGQQD